MHIMDEFERSSWSNGEFSRKYLDEADMYIPELIFYLVKI